jgi:sterol desaturase/sphingolipid hydroxylase (fatty acid hydroxylase superfamily)
MILGLCFLISWERWLIGLAIGLVWGNAFEYAYHRWLLHWPRSSFGKGHMVHHGTVGSPAEPEHVTFGGSPLKVMALFGSNGIPLLILDRWLGFGVSPGIMTGWTIYLIAVEEIHWRIHLRGWLPASLNAAREYHLAHHDIADGRFNVFFPLFDYLFGSIRPPMREIVLPPAAQPPSNPRLAHWLVAARESILYVWLVVLAIDFRLFTSGRQH